MKLEGKLQQLSDEQLQAVLAQLDTNSTNIETEGGTRGTADRRNVLVVYYVLAEQSPDRSGILPCSEVEGLDERDLREYCSARLPSHMCPSRFIALNKFPALPNGKISYSELPLPRHQQRDTESSDHESAGIEGLLLEILGDILSMDDIRPNDNFFEIGGDSITAIQFISRLRAAGIEIGVEAVTRSNTIAEMSKQCLWMSTEPRQVDAGSEDKKSLAGEKFAASGLSASELDDFLGSFD